MAATVDGFGNVAKTPGDAACPLAEGIGRICDLFLGEFLDGFFGKFLI